LERRAEGAVSFASDDVARRVAGRADSVRAEVFRAVVDRVDVDAAPSDRFAAGRAAADFRAVTSSVSLSCERIASARLPVCAMKSPRGEPETD
jgi:hypothetical protein